MRVTHSVTSLLGTADLQRWDFCPLYGYAEPMTSRSGRGRWERVLQTRSEARLALGRDPAGTDPYAAPPKAKTPPPPSGPVWVEPGPSERVSF